MEMQKTIDVRAIWDNEAKVWVATSNDVPGLATEAETLEKLIHKLKIMIPELLQANGLLAGAKTHEIPFHLMSERSEMIKCGA